MASLPALRGLAARSSSQASSILQTCIRPLASTTSPPTAAAQTTSPPASAARPLHTTAPLQARKPSSSHHQQADPKIVNLSKGLRLTSYMPPPLRMARNRHLRHWTIHRAWLLFRRRQREARERDLMRQYQSMHNACEELRRTAGPGTRETGYLYRVAMEKKGVFGHHGVPIEYARPQTETPAREPWNHDWKR
ncbi:uncharacterized protein E0L32_006821 [Thyridium curvatum]|uniref:Uncharacterized protein n=1 Tax=Thyridium curvatum TaxID=1093900 RepID=A0A507B4Z0_9PEZI|nr:uncharacterized protein E0L32_006821 [Thyridium curvatum]TPX12409.1 hypothetical protein E0L32_006821 [Thyridium curvatum]